jgi:hypothetical protein
MVYKSLVRMGFVLSTLYTIILLVVFAMKRDSFVIPLTYRSSTYKWGDLMSLMRDNPLALPPNSLETVLAGWCPGARDQLHPTPPSPQCSCIRNFATGKFANNSAAFATGKGARDLQALGDLQAKGVVDACLGRRTTWRKDTCAHFCQLHLAVPVLVACLCMSLFFSKVVEYRSATGTMISTYLPLLLALLVIVMNFLADALAAIPAVLTVLSALFEMTFSCCCAEPERVYWSFQRFFIGSLAVWAAMTHQARDLYVISSYAVLGFYIGMLAYTEFVTRFRQGCNARPRAGAIYNWVGICAISACLALLVQQHWYPDSPVWSTPISVACLAFACLQCVVMLPGVWIPDSVQLFTGVSLLSASVVTVLVDTL